jgi:hypothetical protein
MIVLIGYGTVLVRKDQLSSSKEVSSKKSDEKDNSKRKDQKEE